MGWNLKIYSNCALYDKNFKFFHIMKFTLRYSATWNSISNIFYVFLNFMLNSVASRRPKETHIRCVICLFQKGISCHHTPIKHTQIKALKIYISVKFLTFTYFNISFQNVKNDGCFSQVYFVFISSCSVKAGRRICIWRKIVGWEWNFPQFLILKCCSISHCSLIKCMATSRLSLRNVLFRWFCHCSTKWLDQYEIWKIPLFRYTMSHKFVLSNMCPASYRSLTYVCKQVWELTLSYLFSRILSYSG